MSHSFEADSQAYPELTCEQWESNLADALDGRLGRRDSQAFDRHSESCIACAELLKEARQGIAWLGLLKNEPEVPAGLLRRILIGASGSTSSVPSVLSGSGGSAKPAWYQAAIPLRQMGNRRVIMTAAMAFFSIALTLKVSGVRLSAIDFSDLSPAAVRTSLSRHFYATTGEVAKYYENLRFVYEMEARVRELKRSAVEQPIQTPPAPQKAAPASPGNGSAHRGESSPEAGEGLA